MANRNDIIERTKSLTWGEIVVGMRSHHCESHVNVDDSYLKDRIKYEKVSGATTLDLSEDEIVQMIKDYILDPEYDEAGAIAEWLDDLSEEDEYECYKDCSAPIGHGYLKSKVHDWKKGALSCSQFYFVIGRKYTAYNSTDWYIKTVYCRPVKGIDF